MVDSKADTPKPPSQSRNALDRYFKITERGSTVGREIRGGLVTFFTMAYIIALNPLIIGTAKDADGQLLGGGTTPNFAMIAAATALVAGVVTILMGVVANFPLALATGLGLNAFVAFGIASQMSWADAMGLVVLEGLVILVLVLTGLRKAVFDAVPKELKVAISVGIGLFIALIGFVDAGFVRRTGNPPVPVELGVGGFLDGWPVVVFVIGVLAIAIMMLRKVKGAILFGIIGATILAIIIEAIFRIGPSVDGDKVNPTGWGLNVPTLPERWFSLPDFSLVGQFDLIGAFSRVGVVAAVLLVFTLMLADFFDTMGTMTAIGSEANLLDAKGQPPNTQRILIVDSVAAAAGGAASVSSNTSYIESAAGVGEGARTGLASVVTGICFLLATVFAPVVEIIPYEAATPALIIVGFLMMLQIREIPWNKMEIALPAFLTIVVAPFTYSITAGIGAGFVSYVVLQLASGKGRKVHPLMWIVAALFVVYFAIRPISDLLGV
jgi:AGZA family xanthine/uracil permease-like MFS transporter